VEHYIEIVIADSVAAFRSSQKHPQPGGSYSIFKWKK